ncbi:hypothetical protein JCM10207_007615 [Rhodosporidiobolus poonsookiae]
MPKKAICVQRHSIRISCDVRCNMGIPDLDYQKPLAVSDLPGSWLVFVQQTPNREVVKAGFFYGECPFDGESPETSVECELMWIDPAGGEHSVHKSLREGAFPDPTRKIEYWHLEGVNVSNEEWGKAVTRSEGAFQPRKQRHYRLRLDISRSTHGPAQKVNDLAEALAARIGDLHSRQLPHNIRLCFPRPHKDGAELWSSSDLLLRSSAYFKTLLESGFAETVSRRGKRKRVQSPVEPLPQPSQADNYFSDSDDETDAFLFSKNPPVLDSSSEADEVSYRQITITHTAFSTYRAILVYLSTGFIRFTPLSSSFPTTAWATRDAFLANAYEDNPSLPLPVLPKSAYRLAHLLQLEDLQQLCLDALRGSLAPRYASIELFSSASLLYAALRKVIVEHAVKNLDEVKKTGAWKTAMSQLKAGERLEVGPVVAEVFEAVAGL